MLSKAIIKGVVSGTFEKSDNNYFGIVSCTNKKGEAQPFRVAIEDKIFESLSIVDGTHIQLRGFLKSRKVENGPNWKNVIYAKIVDVGCESIKDFNEVSIAGFVSYEASGDENSKKVNFSMGTNGDFISIDAYGDLVPVALSYKKGKEISFVSRLTYSKWGDNESFNNIALDKMSLVPSPFPKNNQAPTPGANNVANDDTTPSASGFIDIPDGMMNLPFN